MMKTEQERINEAERQVELKKQLIKEKEKEIEELDPIRFNRRLKKLQQELNQLKAEYYNAINIYNIIR